MGYDMLIRDWSADLCSSDLHSFFHDVDRLCTETITQIVRTAKLLGDKLAPAGAPARSRLALSQGLVRTVTDVYTACHFEFATIELRRLNALNETERKAYIDRHPNGVPLTDLWRQVNRSEEHTSELQSLMRISYAVFCFKKKNTHL